jgi:hypothetical protein
MDFWNLVRIFFDKIIQVKKKKLLLNRIRACINSKKERRDVRKKKKDAEGISKLWRQHSCIIGKILIRRIKLQ